MQDIILDIEALEVINEIRDIKRNIRQLCSFIEGEVVGDRSMGINWSVLDNKPEIANTMMINELTDKIELYEPRVIVEEIDVKYDFDKMHPNIKIVNNEDYEEGGDEEDEYEDD